MNTVRPSLPSVLPKSAEALPAPTESSERPLPASNAAPVSALPPGPPARPLDGAETLSYREAEVARWLMLGKRDREIAQILSISYRTVQKHVERILDKLGVETRTAAAAHLMGRGFGPRPPLGS